MTMLGVTRTVGLAALAAGTLAISSTAQPQTQSQPQPAPKAAKAAKPASSQPKQDPAEAARSVDNGQTSFQAGRHDVAVQQLTAGIQGGGLATADMARALYLRGAAQRALGKPALAIADLTSALWLKNGLKDADRQDALQQRSAAYREAGLPDQAPPGGAARTQTASAAGAPAAAAAAPAQATTSAGGGIGGFFSNLFGGSGSQPAPSQAAPAAPPPTQAAASSWSTVTNSTDGAPRTGRPARPPPASSPIQTASVKPPAPTAAAPTTNRFQLQIASARSRAEAETVAQRMRQQNPQDVQGRQIEISEGAFGGQTYYRVRVGPFAAAAEPAELCAKLRGQGFDCLPLSQ